MKKLLLFALVFSIFLSYSALAENKKEEKSKSVKTETVKKESKKDDKSSVSKKTETKKEESKKEIKKSEANQEQCQATTKSGKQCSRKAVKGSKYCFQHQEKSK